MFLRTYSTLVLIFLFSLTLFADFDENAGKAPEFVKKGVPHLAMEWSVPLKKNQVQVNRREEAGVTLFGENLLVATRAGGLHLFGKNGGLKVTAVFEGEFTVAPVAVPSASAPYSR